MRVFRQAKGVVQVGKQRVEEFVTEMSKNAPTHHDLVQEVRSIVSAIVPDVEERVMYGGIVFDAPATFCGVFAHAGHVSVEFTRGCDLGDAYGVLEGKGVRRHLKLREPSDIEVLHVREFISLAYAELLPG